MTYQEVVNSLKLIANAVSPSATWYRGRLSDISLDSIVANDILIYCVDDFSPVRSTDDFERWTFTIAFLKKDSPVSESMTENQVDNEDSREEIYNEMFNLARSFKDTLQYNDDINLPIENWDSLQLTRRHEGVYTGWGVNFTVIVHYDCDDGSGVTKICADATYQNSDGTFVQAIESGSAYTSPDITVTDVDGSTREVPTNKNVTCIAAPCAAATAVLKNSALTTISTTSIASGAIGNITAPDATAVLKNTLGTTITTEAVPSTVSENITIANVAWTDSDGSAESTPYNTAIVCTAQVKTVELYFAFTAGTDTSALATNGGTTWTLTAISDDGASGAITVSDNGGAYGAFVNPTTIANAETIQVKRTTTTGAGWVLITGTYE